MVNKYDDIKLIGLCGLAGCGKDTLANEMKSEGWESIALAQPLKSICIEHLGLSYDDVYTQEGKMKKNDFWGMTNREILQKFGTDAMRNNFHKDVWVKITQLKLKKLLNDNKKVIITDCRFDNEAQMVERLGGIIMKIERSNLQSNLSEDEQKHISEQGISEKYLTYTILNNRDFFGLKKDFQYKLLMFEKIHFELIDELYKLVNQQLIDENLTTKLILCLKKFLHVRIDNVYPIKSSKNIRFEWYKRKEIYYPSLITDNENNKVIFKAINSKDEINSYELNFDFDDVENWNNVNDWLNKNKE